MLRSLFKLSLCAFLTVSATGYDANAEEDPFYFCAGAYVEEMKANAVIVLRADMSAIDPKAKKYLNCQLMDVDETTLLRLITSGRNEKLDSSGLRYFKELFVSGKILPVTVVKIPTYSYEKEILRQRYKSVERICGYDQNVDKGLFKRVRKNSPGCNKDFENYFGFGSDGAITEIYCESNDTDCLFSIEYGGWKFSLIAEKQTILNSWNELHTAFTQEISSKVLLSFTPDLCVGETCALLDRLIKQK